MHATARSLLAAAAAFTLAPLAGGVVVSGRDPLPRPTNSYVASWNGSSAVAIAPTWLITAKHVGGSAGQGVWMNGLWYTAVEVVQHPSLDAMLVRVDPATPLPGYHRLADAPLRNDPVLLGGMGVTAGNDVNLESGERGYDWSGPRQETWAANTVSTVGSFIAINFSPPSDPTATPHEGIFAVNDSGAGLFTIAADGELELAGVAVSVFGWGMSVYGTTAFALSTARWADWARTIIGDPAEPVASSVVAPPVGE